MIMSENLTDITSQRGETSRWASYMTSRCTPRPTLEEPNLTVFTTTKRLIKSLSLQGPRLFVETSPIVSLLLSKSKISKPKTMTRTTANSQAAAADAAKKTTTNPVTPSQADKNKATATATVDQGPKKRDTNTRDTGGDSQQPPSKKSVPSDGSGDKDSGSQDREEDRQDKDKETGDCDRTPTDLSLIPMSTDIDDYPKHLKTTIAPKAFFKLSDLNAEEAQVWTPEMKVVQYRVRIDNGLGLHTPEMFEDTLVAMLPNGTRTRMNEPSNRMGMKVLISTVKTLEGWKDDFKNGRPIIMDLTDPNKSKGKKKNKKGTVKDKKIGSFGEKDAFIHTYHAITREIQIAAGYGTDEVYHDRRTEIYWKIQCGFNTRTPYNPELRRMTIHFAEIRLGLVPVTEGTEFRAMVTVCQSYYLKFTSDGKTGSMGKGPAWMLMIHMLNEHLSTEGITPIAIHPDKKTDAAIYQKRRNQQTKDLWHNGDKLRVEARDEVRQELLAYLKRVTNRDREADVPVDEGPPSSAEDSDTQEEGELRAFIA